MSPSDIDLMASKIIEQMRFRQLPSVVYRFFQKECEADALVEGRVWASTLSYCRDVEHAERGDKGEARHTYSLSFALGRASDRAFVAKLNRLHIGVLDGPQLIEASNNESLTWIPDAWLVCTTLRFDPDAMASFGRYCVEISHVADFLHALNDAIEKEQPLRYAKAGLVRYGERDYEDDDPPPGPLGFVKPRDQFAKQHEYRFLFVPEGRPLLKRRDFVCPAIVRYVTRIA